MDLLSHGITVGSRGGSLDLAPWLNKNYQLSCLKMATHYRESTVIYFPLKANLPPLKSQLHLQLIGIAVSLHMHFCAF